MVDERPPPGGFKRTRALLSWTTHVQAHAAALTNLALRCPRVANARISHKTNAFPQLAPLACAPSIRRLQEAGCSCPALVLPRKGGGLLGRSGASWGVRGIQRCCAASAADCQQQPDRRLGRHRAPALRCPRFAACPRRQQPSRRRARLHAPGGTPNQSARRFQRFRRAPASTPFLWAPRPTWDEGRPSRRETRPRDQPARSARRTRL